MKSLRVPFDILRNCLKNSLTANPGISACDVLRFAGPLC
jgi:hypothetical protein